MPDEEVVETTETSTETDDAEISAPEENPTEQSDAEGEEAPKAPDPAELAEKLAKAEKKLAKTSYETREARRREERLMAMLEKAEPKQAESAAPKIDDFETLDDYIDARFKYLEGAKAPKETAPKADTVFVQKRDDLFFEGSGKYDDFVEKVTSESASVTPAMAEAIFEVEDMDVQVELAYYLANNPRESLRIAKLSPLRQVSAIGQLEAKLTAPKPAKRASAAPEPIKPVGGAKTSSDAHRPDDSFEAFLKKRTKELGRV